MKILWGRILVIGLLFEVFAILLLNFVVKGLLNYSYSQWELTLALFLGALACGYWVASKSSGNELKHGILIGISTVLIYIFISESAELAGKFVVHYDLLYFIKHIAKILGASLGGYFALVVLNKSADSKAGSQTG